VVAAADARRGRSARPAGNSRGTAPDRAHRSRLCACKPAPRGTVSSRFGAFWGPSGRVRGTEKRCSVLRWDPRSAARIGLLGPKSGVFQLRLAARARKARNRGTNGELAGSRQASPGRHRCRNATLRFESATSTMQPLSGEALCSPSRFKRAASKRPLARLQTTTVSIDSPTRRRLRSCRARRAASIARTLR
jgi:hypothetical protein